MEEKSKSYKLNRKITHLELQDVLDSVSVSPHICRLVFASGPGSPSEGSAVRQSWGRVALGTAAAPRSSRCSSITRRCFPPSLSQISAPLGFPVLLQDTLGTPADITWKCRGPKASWGKHEKSPQSSQRWELGIKSSILPLDGPVAIQQLPLLQSLPPAP